MSQVDREDAVAAVLVEPGLELLGLGDPVLVGRAAREVPFAPLHLLAQLMASEAELVVHAVQMDEMQRRVEVGLSVHAGVEPEVPVHRSLGEQRLRVREVRNQRRRCSRIGRSGRWGLAVLLMEDLVARGSSRIGGQAIDVVAERVVLRRVRGDDLVDVAEQHELVALEQLVLAACTVSRIHEWSTYGCDTISRMNPPTSVEPSVEP